MLVGVAARLGERIRGNLADCDDGRVADRQPMPVACRMAVARAGLKPGLTENGDQIEVVVEDDFEIQFVLGSTLRRNPPMVSVGEKFLACFLKLQLYSIKIWRESIFL